jgi:formate dehydrogenase major subunit
MRIYVDEHQFESDPSERILDLLNKNSIFVPQICYNPKLGSIETCDACVVEVGGHLVRACATKLSEEMRVSVNSQRASDARLKAVDRILRDHNLYCTVCDKNGNCALHTTVLKLGIKSQDFRKKGYAVDDSNPFYTYDPDQCILCGRCVEVCQDVVVNEVITIDWKLNPPRVVWDRNSPINQSSCVSCGACSSVCPVNALMEKSIIGEAGYFTRLEPDIRDKMITLVKDLEPSIGGFRPIMQFSDIEAMTRSSFIKKTKTVCTYCGVGCSFDVWTKGRKILKIQPNVESPANGMASCIKGKFGWDFINSSERLTQPLMRDGDHFREATWEEVIPLIGEKLSEIKKNFGPDSIGIIGDCTGTNEEAYLAQKLARQVIGTHNVDNCARYCQAPATTGLFRTVGIGGDAGSMEDIFTSDLVITVGSNTAESHPVLAGKIKRAQKLNGQKLIVMDVRAHQMAERANLFIKPRSGTDLIVLNAVANYIVWQSWENKEFIREKTTNYDEYKKSLERFTLKYAEEATGVPKETIVEMANMIHEAKNTCILFAMGVTQHQDGSETSTAISNLLLLTGNYGRHSCGAYPLRGHANVQGASDFGALPGYFPGYEKVTIPEVKKRYENAWGVKITDKPGLTSTEMVDAILDGRLHAMIIMGEDKVLADSNQARVREAFSKLDFLVVVEIFLTKTAEQADIVLPAAASLEKEGTFVNTERRIQRLYKVLEPLGQTKTELEIIQGIANTLGANWKYRNPSEVMEEVASLSPFFAGVTYERLEGYKSLQWPVAADGKDSPYLYEEGFHFPDRKAKFFPTKWIDPLSADIEYDFMLNNGRMLEHFHWGNMTFKDRGIVEKVPRIFVEIPKETADEKGLKDGDTVRISSRISAIKAKVLVTNRVSGKTLFLAIHDSDESAINVLTSDYEDPSTHTAAYKEVPVKLEKIETSKEAVSPLPLVNPRFYKGISQVGVQVEGKRKRPEYAPLAD